MILDNKIDWDITSSSNYIGENLLGKKINKEINKEIYKKFVKIYIKYNKNYLKY